MRIKSLRIKNNFLGWEIKEINFTSNLTLLVGGSGVGKTQILNAINDLKNIANGKGINGFEWEISFSIISGREFKWEGSFSIVEDDSEKLFRHNENKEHIIKPIIQFERLTELNRKEVLLERNSDNILFKGREMPKLSSTESMINILKEEEQIKEISDAFKKIFLKDHTRREKIRIRFIPQPSFQLKEKYNTIEKIRGSNEPIHLKLFLCSELKLAVFDTIKNRFKNIFPQIEALKIEQTNSDELSFAKQTVPIISIKEKTVPKWIREDRMSSGMLRTIIHISELYLSNEGSVILIDEFENSLGVNCLDILTDDLIHENKTLQFIATSHHPYIINNIPYEYWKIVSRLGGEIQVRDAADYKLGRSKQDAFLQLTKILERQSAWI